MICSGTVLCVEAVSRRWTNHSKIEVFSGAETILPEAERQRVLLAWSVEDIQRHGEQASIIVPLSPEAFVVAGQRWHAKLVDTGTILGSGESISDSVDIGVRRTEAVLMQQEPWAECAGGITLERTIGHALLWDRLLSGLCKIGGQVPIEVVPPLAFEQQSFALLKKESPHSVSARHSFWACAESFRRRNHIRISAPGRSRYQVRKKKYLRLLKMGLGAAVGYLVIRAGRILVRESAGEGQSTNFVTIPKADLLLVGIQATDAVHQGALAQRLSARFGRRFLWLSYSQGEISRRCETTPEEGAPFSAARKHGMDWITSDEIPESVWRHPLLSRLSNAYLCWWLARILAKTVHSSLSRMEWFEQVSRGGLSYLRPRYERWSRFLVAVSPRVIGGLSTIQHMAFIRTWARRNGVPFVLFPHGVFRTIRWRYQIDGDYLGVFGKIMAEQIQASGISKAREIALCGSMQFGMKLSGSVPSNSPRLAPRRTVLYVATSFTYRFFPSSPGQVVKELSDLHDACRSLGCELIVREHPRGGKNWLRPVVEDFERKFAGTIRMSTEPSLLKDFSSVGVVVTAEFDGAVLDALMSRKIVIAYLSKDSWNASLDVLGRIGCFLRTKEELEHVLRDVLEGGRKTAEIYQKEQEFLERYVDDPSRDPWERAEELLVRVLEEQRLAATLTSNLDDRHSETVRRGRSKSVATAE